MRLIRRMKERAAEELRARRESWGVAAQRVGGELVTGDKAPDDRVVVDLGPFTIVLDWHVVSNGQVTVTYTRARSYFSGHREMKVKVRRRNALDRLLEALGWAGRLPLSPALLDRFVVKGKPAARVPSLFTAELVAALLSVPHATLEVKRPSRKSRKRYGEDAGVVVCQSSGIVTDPDRLVGMVTVVGATLEGLARTGQARER